MNTNWHLRSLIAAVAMASTAGAFAQSTATPPSPPTPKMTSDAARAESDYRTAKDACNAQPASTRDQCLRDAKTKYDRALNANPAATGKGSNDGGGTSTGSGQTGGGENASGSTGQGTTGGNSSGGNTGSPGAPGGTGGATGSGGNPK